MATTGGIAEVSTKKEFRGRGLAAELLDVSEFKKRVNRVREGERE